MPLLIAIIAVLVVGGVVYIYSQKKSEVPQANQPLDNVQTNQNPQNNQQPPHIDSVTPFVDPNGNTQFSVKGSGFLGSNPYVDGQSATYSASSLTDTEVTLLSVKQLAVPGNHSVYLTNPTTGKSNVFSFQSGAVNSNSHSQNNVAKTVSVSGMLQYTDSIFGFSFWYPATWSVQKKEAFDTNPEKTYEGGSLIETITVSPPQGSSYGIAIEEFVSADKSIKDNSVCGPADGCPSAIRYYFDSSIHTWMKDSYFDYGQYSSPTKTAPADVSVNSMGGLHILRGNARFGDNVIVPLSAKNFLVVHNVGVGTNSIKFLANTILALDPAVATPVSSAQQIQTIQAEGNEYASYKW